MAKSARGKDQRTAILILGMHRSGTSALTRMLNLLGCDLPEALVPAKRNDNPLGFWESRAVVDLNKAILESAGASWDGWTAFNSAWYDSPLKSEFLERAGEILQSEYGDSRLFVIKDPRICRLAPFWSEALAAAGVRPAAVLALRNPREVAASMERRNMTAPGVAQLSWLRHMLSAEESSRAWPRTVVSYDDLLADWRGAADRIGHALELSWPRRSAAVDADIDAFISPSERHHAEPDARVTEGGGTPGWIGETYDVLRRWSRDETRDGDEAALDAVRFALDEATPAFERAVLSARKLAAGERELRTELERAEKERAALGERAETAETALQAREAELDALTSRIEDDAARAAEADAALEELERVKAEADEQKRRAVEAEAALERLKIESDERAVELEREKESAQERVSRIEARLQSRSEEIATLSRMALMAEENAAQAQRLAKSALSGLMGTLSGEAGRVRLPLLSKLPAVRRRDLARRAEMLRRSGLFDADWYREQNPDVDEAGMDPAEHYIAYGMREGRRPFAEVASGIMEELKQRGDNGA